MSTGDLMRLRLATQLIEPARTGTVPAVVGHLLAMQAQDFTQGVWALGCRSPGSTRADVDAALETRQVVRSWPMRGTLHFVRPADLRWMLRLTFPRLFTGLAARHRQLGLDLADFDRAEEAAIAGLSGGRRATRAEFLTVLNDGGIATDGQRGPHIIGVLAQRGIVCWGPPSGSQQALVLLDEWAPEQVELDRDASLREFVLRYFRGHGPATIKDFCWWSKVTVADAKRGIEQARGELVELSDGDTTYWMGAEEADAASVPSPSGVHALPGFDEYVLGYQSRSFALEPEFAGRIVPGNNGIFLPMIVSGGRVIGTWRRAVGKTGVTVTALPFEELSPDEAAGFAREVARYGEFLDMPARVA